ncbi:hypothetical protein RCH10_005261 [Variovorax sp. GrIS 2.14]|jgi:hypothetical protein
MRLAANITMTRPKDFKYKSRRIAVQTCFVDGGWHWFYEIDRDLPISMLTPAIASESEALIAAEVDAKLRIDSMG